ncbi:unnamed protein product [Gordionus sp. m RMFG-2023]
MYRTHFILHVAKFAPKDRNIFPNLSKYCSRNLAQSPKPVTEPNEGANKKSAAIVKAYGEKLVIEEIKHPDPATHKLGKDDVVIQPKTSSLTFADLLMIQGKYQIKPDVPFVAGREVSGKILETGGDVKDFKKGDKIFAFLPNGGGFANTMILPQKNCFALPQNMDYKVASSLYTSYITAYLGLVYKGNLTSHDKVLVTGAGGAVGMAAVDICANAYKTKVIGVTSSPEKSEAIRQKGAFATIELSNLYKTSVNAESEKKKVNGKIIESPIKQKVLALTDGKGVDLIYETLGGSIFEDCVKCLSFDGRLLIIGFSSGTIPSIQTNRLLLKNHTLIGFTMTNYYNQEPNTIFQESFQAISSYWEKSYIHPTIDPQSFDLSKINDAIEYLKHKKSIGKVIINLE